MGIGIDNTADYYLRTSSLPSISTFTVALWFRRTSDYGTHFLPLIYRNNGAGDTEWIALALNGASYAMYLENQSVSDTGSATTLDQWYHAALVKSGNDYSGYLDAVLDVNFTDSSTVTNTRLYVGGNDFAGGWTPSVDMAAVKIWDGVALTAAEVANEMRSYVPIRLAGLYAFYPMFSIADDETDFSGNGHTWTVNGTPATVDGPPIPWRARRSWRRSSMVALAGPAFVSYFRSRRLRVA